MKNRVLVVGLDEPEIIALRQMTRIPLVAHSTLPRIQLRGGQLYAESAKQAGLMLPVDGVIFHGIFADDFDFLTALALWNGPCLPSAKGLLDCRLRHPCLIRSVAVSQFGDVPRGFVLAGDVYKEAPQTPLAEWPSKMRVAKWSNWHCGENKALFSADDVGAFTAPEAAVIEPFIEGDSVRIARIGPHQWQISLTGDDWKKSIHHNEAAIVPEQEIDAELAADTLRLSRELGLEMLGVDYILDRRQNRRYLLEVNHIPNVTVFAPMRQAFLEYATAWIED